MVEEWSLCSEVRLAAGGGEGEGAGGSLRCLYFRQVFVSLLKTEETQNKERVLSLTPSKRIQ